MTIEHEQWKEILSAVNKETDLSRDNVIEKIKEKLKAADEGEYKKWEEADFDVNYSFHTYYCFPALHTLLHFAAIGGCTNVVNTLKGANVHQGNEYGWTPLHFAAKNGHIDTVKALIARSADPLSKNKDGKTPKDLAGDDNIKNFLREAEEKQTERSNTAPQDKSEDTTHLLERTEEEQPTSAIAKGVFAGGAVAVLGAAIAVTLFATGTVAVELMSVMIAAAIVTAAALAVGGITYSILKPSTKMDKTKEAQNVNEKKELCRGD